MHAYNVMPLRDARLLPDCTKSGLLLYSVLLIFISTTRHRILNLRTDLYAVNYAEFKWMYDEWKLMIFGVIDHHDRDHDPKLLYKNTIIK
jgi:hypothetical protein